MLRGRFAPTPSGELHMGSLVCALASYLDVKKRGGEWVVRIEDVDLSRCRSEYESSILRQLERHGLQWDGPVVRQSERFDLYRECLSELKNRDLVYQCFCSRSHLRNFGCFENPQGELIYPGFCRSSKKRGPQQAGVTKFSLRFAMTTGHYRFEDIVCGWVEGNVSTEVGDFVVRRADGCFAYHLAVVVDDHHQGITRVVRGSDILPLTGRHLLLMKALGFQQPVFGHIPLVLGQDGQKLSKSASAQAIAQQEVRTNLIKAFAHLGIDASKYDGSSVGEMLQVGLEAYELT